MIIVKKTACEETSDGIDCTVYRAIGGDGMHYMDPILLLDWCQFKRPQSFPAHPHRGFESLTLCLGGSMRQRDFLGNDYVLEQGDVQLVSHARGMVSGSEPLGDECCTCVQFWINTPREWKMLPPQYQYGKRHQIPTVSNGYTLSVVSGRYLHLEGILKPMCDVDLWILEIEQSTFVHVLFMIVAIRRREEYLLETCFMDNTPGTLEITASEKAIVVIVSCKPTLEPVMHRGPFVMSTEGELRQAIMDLQNQRNGFEGTRAFMDAF
ncbi:RmlC-like cupin domain-containing protein [Gorgonomyces haynaldii]|nr:RmlC-like cupin domain-containing protein [Gorgonomyces haynaldii]